jgi:hypothetical protein
MKRRLKKEIKDIMAMLLLGAFVSIGCISIHAAGKKYESTRLGGMGAVVEGRDSTTATQTTKSPTTTMSVISSFTTPSTTRERKQKFYRGTNPATQTAPPHAVRICEYLPILPEDGGGEVYFDPELQRYMMRLSEENNLEYEFVLAICYVETKFNPSLNNAGLNANGTTDWGLMQLNDAYIGAFCEMYNDGVPVDMLNAYDNAKIGISVLGDISSRQSTLYDVACSYNMGEYGWTEYKNNVSASWHYGDKVLEYYGYIKNYFRDVVVAESQR